MTAFWDNAPCSLIEVDQHFRGAYFPYHQGARTHVHATTINQNAYFSQLIAEQQHISLKCNFYSKQLYPAVKELILYSFFFPCAQQLDTEKFK
jgi:hypothetical protein